MRHSHTAAHSTEPFTTHPVASKALSLLLAVVVAFGCSAFMELGEVYADDEDVASSGQVEEEAATAEAAGEGLDGEGSDGEATPLEDEGDLCDAGDAVEEAEGSAADASDGSDGSDGGSTSADGLAAASAGLMGSSLSTLADSSDDDIASGSSGGCSWLIDANGVLYIYPKTGSSGTLDSTKVESDDDYDQKVALETETVYAEIPWYDYREYVKSVVIEDGAHAGTSALLLFYGCENLVFFTDENDEDDGFVTSSTTDIAALFYGDSSLSDVSGLSKWDTSGVSSLDFLFYGCSSLSDLSAISGWRTSSFAGLYYAFADCSSLQDVDDLESWDVSSVTSLGDTFNGCSSLSDLSGISGWDTESVDSLSRTFYDCTSLKNPLQLRNWDVSKVTTMSATFSGCSSMTTLRGLGSWELSEEMSTLSNTFSYCSSLTSTGLSYISGWDTSHVTNFGSTFNGCSALTSLSSLSTWDTSSATNLMYTFGNCSSLTNLDGLSSWGTSSVTNLSYTFYGCSSLTDLSAISNWTTSKVTTLASTFRDCSSMASLDLSDWNTSNVTTLNYTFYDCSSLASLDVSGWDVTSTTTRNYCFEGCSSLCSITLGEDWDWKRGSGRTNRCTTTQYGGLPTPPTDTTTGEWVEDDGSYGPLSMASLAYSWTSAYAGTWVWDYLSNGSLAISKTVVNGTDVTAEQSFTFTVSLYDSDGDELTDDYAYATEDEEGDEVEGGSGAVASGGEVTLMDGQTLTITGLPEGATYVVSESSRDGYTASSEGSSGTIEADGTSVASFTNTYSASGSWTPTATKTLEGGIDLEEGAFGFVLTDADGNELSSGSNAAADYEADEGSASAAISFDDVVEYTAADAGQTYTYTMYEAAGNDGDISYDESVYTVEVTVVDDGDGTLSVEAAYCDEDGDEVDGVVFVNTYSHTVALPESGGDGAALGWLAAALAVLAASGVALVLRERSRRGAAGAGVHMR